MIQCMCIISITFMLLIINYLLYIDGVLQNHTTHFQDLSLDHPQVYIPVIIVVLVALCGWIGCFYLTYKRYIHN